MELEQARAAQQAGHFKEVVIEPADEGNGWMVLLHDQEGQIIRITDAHGAEKIYHSLDHATEIAKSLGFETVRVEEVF